MTNLPTERRSRSSLRTNGALRLGATVVADADAEIIGAAQAIAGGPILAVVSTAVVSRAFETASRQVVSATAARLIADAY